MIILNKIVYNDNNRLVIIIFLCPVYSNFIDVIFSNNDNSKKHSQNPLYFCKNFHKN